MDIIKKTILILVPVLLTLHVNAQNADSLLDKFKTSFTKEVFYPDALLSQNEATSTLLKIDVDDKGMIIGMNLSDSADPFLAIEFYTRLKILDTCDLKKYVQLNLYKGVTLLMPVNYYFTSNNNLEWSLRAERQVHFFDFNGKKVNGKVIILTPLNNAITITIDR